MFQRNFSLFYTILNDLTFWTKQYQYLLYSFLKRLLALKWPYSLGYTWPVCLYNWALQVNQSVYVHNCASMSSNYLINVTIQVNLLFIPCRVWLALIINPSRGELYKHIWNRHKNHGINFESHKLVFHGGLSP